MGFSARENEADWSMILASRSIWICATFIEARAVLAVRHTMFIRHYHTRRIQWLT